MLRTTGSRAVLGGSALVVTRLLGLATAMITVPLLARHLGASGYGRLTIVLNIVYIAIVVADLGLSMLVSREVPSLVGEERGPWLASFWSVRWATALAVTLGAVVVTVVAPVGGKANMLLALAVVPIVAVHGGISAVFTADLDPWPTVRGEVAHRAVWVTLVVGVVWWNGSLAMVIAALVAAHLAGLAATAAPRLPAGIIRGPTLRLGDGARRLLRSAGPLALIPVLGAVYARSDALILALVAPQSDVGIYGAIWKIVEAALAVVVVASALLLPKLSGTTSVEQRRWDFTRTMRVLLTLYLPGAVMLAFLGGPLLEVVGGGGFAGAIDAPGGQVSPAVAVAITAGVLVVMVFGIASGALMVACRRQGALLRQLALVLAVNLPLVWLLGARWSIVGVAAAGLISEVVGAVHGWRIVRQEIGSLDVASILRWPLAIAGAVAVAMAVALPASPFAALVVGGIVAAGMAWLSPGRSDVADVLRAAA